MAIMEKLSLLPDRPGVYIFRDAAGEVIYVGKASSLKNRVRSYYQASACASPKVRALVSRAADLEYIVTDNEVEALLLEANLIKEHRPRYNVYLRDDKSYPFLKVTLAEDFPRVLITRRVVKDGSRYFGPYTEVGAVRETLDLVRRLFPFRTCQQKLEEGRPVKNRPCLNYHIGRCLAPCSGEVGKEEYRAIIHQVCLFLEGRQDDLVKELTRRMKEAAQRLEFERAARLRDQIAAVRKVLESQKVLFTDAGDLDILAAAQRDGLSLVLVFFVRHGKLLGKDQFFLERAEGADDAEILTAFLKQYYAQADFVPPEVLLAAADPEELPAIEEWLSRLRGSRVKLSLPRRGKKKELVEMAAKNALLALEEARARAGLQDQSKEACQELARELGLPSVPRRLECFDVSHIQGAETVASLAVFEDGRPSPDQYRRFKIRTALGSPDDYAAMREAVSRRFARLVEERRLINTGQLSTRQAKFYRLPDLVVVDGGKGQLACARKAMEELGFGHITAIALAKEEELIYTAEHAEPLRLPRDSAALKLLQRLRDEAHRFAVGYHRVLRRKRTLSSVLDEIEGIGPARRRALLKAFPSLEAIARATVEELAAVPGMNRSVAEAVYRYFHPTGGKDGL